MESRISGASDYNAHDRLDFAYDLWHGLFLVAGGYTILGPQRLVDEEYPYKDIVVIFGGFFISNLDLFYRVKEAV